MAKTKGITIAALTERLVAKRSGSSALIHSTALERERFQADTG
jgi:hypothetical protein